MKKLIQYIAAGAILLMVGASCKDNENWRIIPYVPEPVETANIQGSATIYSGISEATELRAVELEKGEPTKYDTIADIVGLFTWLKASGDFTIVESGITYGKGDVVSSEKYETVALKEGGSAFTVTEDGLYYVLLNNADKQLTVVPVKLGIIGDATPKEWNSETAMTMSFDGTSVVTAKWSGALKNNQLKFRYSGDWGLVLPYGDGEAKVQTNFGSTAKEDGEVLSKEFVACKSGGKNFKIEKKGEHDVTCTINMNTQDVKAAADLTGEDTSSATLPETMYMTGSPNAWDWGTAPDMIPVNRIEGMFWGIYYFKAGDAVKFNNAKAWDAGAFGATNEDPVALGDVPVGGSNMTIGEAGYYQVLITCTLSEDKQSVIKKITLSKPVIYLVGVTSNGGWTNICSDQDKFTFDSASEEFVSPAFVKDSDAGNGVRMCIKLDNADWWQTEFNVFDGKIVYRARGGEMALVPGTTGQKVYLNFKDGTGSIK